MCLSPDCGDVTTGLACVQTNQIVHIKYVLFFVYQLYVINVAKPILEAQEEVEVCNTSHSQGRPKSARPDPQCLSAGCLTDGAKHACFPGHLKLLVIGSRLICIPACYLNAHIISSS